MNTKTSDMKDNVHTLNVDSGSCVLVRTPCKDLAMSTHYSIYQSSLEKEHENILSVAVCPSNQTEQYSNTSIFQTKGGKPCPKLVVTQIFSW